MGLSLSVRPPARARQETTGETTRHLTLRCGETPCDRPSPRLHRGSKLSVPASPALGTQQPLMLWMTWREGETRLRVPAQTDRHRGGPGSETGQGTAFRQKHQPAFSWGAGMTPGRAEGPYAVAGSNRLNRIQVPRPCTACPLPLPVSKLQRTVGSGRSQGTSPTAATTAIPGMARCPPSLGSPQFSLPFPPVAVLLSSSSAPPPPVPCPCRASLGSRREH